MELALKQRLVGATVLVLLAVIFIPMVLDGPTMQSTTTVDLEMPPPNGKMVETRVLPLEFDDRNTPTSTKPQVEPVPTASEIADGSDSENAVQGTPDIAPETPDSLENAERIAQTDSETEAPAPVQDTAVSEPKSDPEPTEPVVSPASEVSKPRPQQQLPDQGWIIQVGSFSEASRAQSLRTQLEAIALPGYVQSVVVDGVAHHRVRVGPFTTEAQALQQSAVLADRRPELPTSIMQLTGSVETPVADQIVKSRKLPGWAVQVGNFSSRPNAERLLEKLREHQLPAFIQQVDSNGSSQFRVRVGPEVSRELASELRDRLAQEYKLSGWLVEHP